MEKMRKFAETKVAKVFLALIFMSFMSWGITGYIMGSSAKKVAFSVADVDVTLGDLAEKVRRQKMQLQQIMGKSMPTPMLDERMLVDQIVKNTIERILFDMETFDVGMLVTQNFTLEQIKTMPEFQKDGKFSSELFHKVLSYNGMSEQGFLSEIGGQHTRYLLRSAIESVEKLPNVLVKNNMKFKDQERVIVIKEFATNNVKKSPTEEDLIASYEQNKHNFIQPEYRQVSALIMKNSHIKGEKTKENLLKMAEDIENEVIGGAEFKEVATQFGIETIRLPLLDIRMKNKEGSDFSHSIISKNLFREAFAIDESLETSLLKIKDGFILLRPEKIIEAMPKPFEQVKELVRKIWTLKQKETINYINANEELTKAQKDKKLTGKIIVLNKKMNVNNDLLSKVFVANINDIFIVKTDEKSVVVQLKEIKTPKLNIVSANFKETKRNMKKQFANMIYDDYLSYLSNKFGVEKEEERIAEYFAPKE